MKLAACDFCDPEGKNPKGNLKTTTIDGRTFDICVECKAKQDEILKGKGVAVMQNVSIAGIKAMDWRGTKPVSLPERPVPRFGDLTLMKDYAHGVRAAGNGRAILT